MCFLDEEPIFDLTDVNVIHLVGLAVSLIACINDNIQKAVFGVSAPTDRVLFLYVGLKSMLLVFYFLVIWLVFFSHTTTALLTECEGTLLLASSLSDMLSCRILDLLLACACTLVWTRLISAGEDLSGGLGHFISIMVCFGLLNVGLSLFIILIECLDCASVVFGTSGVGIGPSDVYNSSDFI
jgi:hypothetical protein